MTPSRRPKNTPEDLLGARGWGHLYRSSYRARSAFCDGEIRTTGDTWVCLRCAKPCPECEGNHSRTGKVGESTAHGELRHVKVWTLKFSHNGRAIVESTKTGDWNRAQAYKRRRFREIHGGDDPWSKARRFTLSDALDLVFARYRREGLKSARKLEAARKSLLRFPGFLKGAVQANSLTETIVNDDFTDWRRQNPMRPGHKVANGTVNQELQLIRTAFRAAYMRRNEHGGRLMPQPPVVKLLRKGAPREGFFNVRMVETLLTAVRGLDERASPSDLADLIEFFWRLGWRNSSARNIERTDVDWFSQEIVLRRVLSKNGEPVRVAFSGDTELTNLLKRREALAVKLEAEMGTKVPLLFFRTLPTWRAGKPIRNFYSAWHAAMVKAGLSVPGRPVLTPHAFRRSIARDMVDAGVDAQLACDRAGWNPNSGMLHRYRILDHTDREKASEALAQYRRTQQQIARQVPMIRRG